MGNLNEMYGYCYNSGSGFGGGGGYDIHFYSCQRLIQLFYFGYGYGCGDGSYGGGSCSGSGYNNNKINISFESALIAYHFICKKVNFIMRNGNEVKINEIIHEDMIEMCCCGLHSSFSIEDAKKYRPENSILTKVLVWGEIIFGEDKIVSTDRMIIQEIDYTE